MGGRIRGTASISSALALALLATSTADAQPTGCGRPLDRGDQTVALTVDGRSRPFLLYVPSGYTGRRALPLVVNLHPTGSTGAGQMDLTGLRGRADEHGYLVAAPTGGAIAGPGNTWVVPGTTPRGEAPPGGFPDDLKYLVRVVDKVQRVACQDRRKVFATGYSGGARMSSALGCSAADRFTAVVADAGIRAGAPTTAADGSPIPDAATCRPARPLPIYALHGTADSTNPYDAGGQPDWRYSVPQAIARWAELDGCPADPSTRAFSGTVDEIAYTPCSAGGFAPAATVVLYRVNGGGHVWFGSNEGVDAGQIVSDVVARHALKPPALRVAGLPAGCVRRSFRLKVTASTDSPVARLEVELARKRLLRVARPVARVRVRRGRRPTTRLVVSVTDRAGLRRVVSKTLRRCDF